MIGLAVVVFFLVLSFFVPSLAFGQSVSSQYCPNPAKDFFKGSIHYEKGEPWIETIVDPDFEQKVLRGERKIGGDIPLTPKPPKALCSNHSGISRRSSLCNAYWSNERRTKTEF